MKKSILCGLVCLLGAVSAKATPPLGDVMLNYVPIYLNAASSGNGYIDESKGSVRDFIQLGNGIKLRNKSLPPKAGGGSNEEAQRVYFTFGDRITNATNLTLKASMTGVPAHNGTWRLVIKKSDGSSVNYNCNFTDTSSNCYDGTNRLIKLANATGAVTGYIEVEGMPDNSEVTFQTLNFIINDDGDPDITAADEYNISLYFK